MASDPKLRWCVVWSRAECTSPNTTEGNYVKMAFAIPLFQISVGGRSHTITESHHDQKQSDPYMSVMIFLRFGSFFINIYKYIGNCKI